MDSTTSALADLSDRLNRIENMLYGGKAVYVGNGRILTKSHFLDLIYYVEADDRLIVPKFVMDGIFEVDITHYLRKNVKEDSSCVDVGANFGYYTCLMAKLASKGKTVGIEADPKIFELTRDNIYINWLNGRATAKNVAVADTIGELELHRRVSRSGNTSIIQIPDATLAAMGEAPQESFKVTSTTLDAEFPDRVDFMKIDVEGAEPLVFRGAKKMIERNPHLKIIMEWSPQQIQENFDVSDFLAELASLNLEPSVLDYEGEPVKTSWAALRETSLCNALLTRA